MNYDLFVVMTITMTCYLWAPSTGDHLVACGAISRPLHVLTCQGKSTRQNKITNEVKLATAYSMNTVLSFYGKVFVGHDVITSFDAMMGHSKKKVENHC